MADYIDRQEVIETVAFYREDPDGIDHALNSIKNIPSADVLPIPDGGICEVSDGYHTFNGLYYQRMVLFGALVNAYPNMAWKSWKHEDGELCFGGRWFIVGIDTPKGSYTYHYEEKYWNWFECGELPVAKHWDGHTEKDVTRLLSLPDVQPVVHCNECKFYDGVREVYGFASCTYWMQMTRWDDYCSHGVRKDGGQ